jgi:hypothetical protein
MDVCDYMCNHYSDDNSKGMLAKGLAIGLSQIVQGAAPEIGWADFRVKLALFFVRNVLKRL